ncbi:hypothetical protein QBC36DRAFT_371476 [Triangularia setosa]|uniref:Uncharacterized protein n=1 Tax=Triangularia setosa TaxID=2587417 RepID=A0AAN7A815_9PEZI|nr:hypothetical protein QBC36DRAFT_371476 [Podospora setosa]
MNGQKQNNISKRVLFAKLMAVATRHHHWQRIYSDHCFLEAQLRQHTNRLFDGLDPRLSLMESRHPAEPDDRVSLNLIDPCILPLPLEIERNATIKSPLKTLTTPPLTTPESTISWDVMSSSLTSAGSFCGMNKAGSLACTAATSTYTSPGDGKIVLSTQGADGIYFTDLELDEPYDQVCYPELLLDRAADRIQHPDLDPGQGQNLGLAYDDDKVWQLQMHFVFRGELIEVWKWLDRRDTVLHPSFMSFPLQLAVLGALESSIPPPTNSQLRNFEAEANDNLTLMTKEIARLESLMDRMSRILHELERNDRDPFAEPISVVLFG